MELAAAAPKTSSSLDALKLGRKYTTSPKFAPAGTDARLWLARLDVERAANALQSQVDLLKVWAEARQSATGDEADVVNVWLWGIPLSNADQTAKTLLPDGLNKQRELFDVSAQFKMTFWNICP